MMKSNRLRLLAIGIATGILSVAWAAVEPAVQAMHGIDAERIRAHLRFPADDLLEGRGTGARGGDIAPRYIAAQFALDGLKPAGDDGTYLQKVDFTGVQTLPSSSAFLEPRTGAALAKGP